MISRQAVLCAGLALALMYKGSVLPLYINVNQGIASREESDRMFQVVKRDGEIADFRMPKITAAIHKAFDAKEKNYSDDMIDLSGTSGNGGFSG